MPRPHAQIELPRQYGDLFFSQKSVVEKRIAPWRRGSFALELQLMQLRIKATLFQELGMIPTLDNLTLIHHENHIGRLDRR
jgi:hypothetical protein